MGEDLGESSELDFIFNAYAGGTGWWQYRTMLFRVATFAMATNMPLIIHIFSADAPEHRCFISGCDSNQTLLNEPWVQFAIPNNNETREFLKLDKTYDQCKMLQRITSSEDSCSANDYADGAVINCIDYVYDNIYYEETLSTKLNLVCNEKYKERLLGTIMMTGLLLGSLIGGRVADKFGRQQTLMVAFFILCPAVIIAGFSFNYAMFVSFQLIYCTILPIIWLASHSYALEMFPKTKRKIPICMSDMLQPLGQCILVGIVYFTRHWTYIHAAVGIVVFLLLFQVIFLPESVRWLAANKRIDDATDLFEKIAKGNGKDMAIREKEEIRKFLNDFQDKFKQNEDSKLTYLDLFRKDQLKYTLIMLVNWVTVNVGTYTLQLNTTKMHGNLYVNATLGALGELPGTLILFLCLESIGRKFTLIIMQTILGGACLVMAFSPQTSPAVLVSYVIGRSAAGAGFYVVWLVSAELFPTNLRSQSVGFSSMVARIFGLICPFVGHLSVYWKPLPMLVLGLPTLLGSFLALFLPETKGKTLPQTTNQASNIYSANQSSDIFHPMSMTVLHKNEGNAHKGKQVNRAFEKE